MAQAGVELVTQVYETDVLTTRSIPADKCSI